MTMREYTHYWTVLTVLARDSKMGSKYSTVNNNTYQDVYKNQYRNHNITTGDNLEEGDSLVQSGGAAYNHAEVMQNLVDVAVKMLDPDVLMHIKYKTLFKDLKNKDGTINTSHAITVFLLMEWLYHLKLYEVLSMDPTYTPTNAVWTTIYDISVICFSDSRFN